MRVEGVAPRTWLLATIAGWALVLWALSLLGMGERIQRLADDPSLLSRLPQLAPAPPERLGPLTQYAEISARPLFSEDRRPQPFSLSAEGDEDAQPTFDFVLTSVLLTPTLKMAIVQPSGGGASVRIKLGEAAEEQPAWRLAALNPRSAVFEGPDGQHTLELRVFDGSGGEPPTAIRQEQAGTDKGTGAASPRPARKPTTRPAAPTTAPVPVPVPAPNATPTPPPASDATDASSDATTEAQIEGIRKRIEERRAQLREQAENPAAPAKNP
jgi:general secretion pathway protein N